MNRRRMMMTQQSKGFELVYDASSGLLPTECGWEIIDEKDTSKKNKNGWLELATSNNGFVEYRSAVNPYASDFCFEVEFRHTDFSQGILLFANDNVSQLSFFLSTTKQRKTQVYQNYPNIIKQGEALIQNVNYTARLEKRNNVYSCYINDELFYNGEIIGTSYTQPNRIRIDGTSLTYIKRMVYKVY